MMFSHIIAGLLAATLGVVAQSSNSTTEKPFALATPGQLVQCKNTTIVWQGGKAPFRVTIKPVCGAGQTGSDEEHVVSAPGATSFELPIKYLADSKVTIGISDSSNMQASAPMVTVVSGDANDSCIVQTACPSSIQAPNAPIALASSSSGAVVPTDHLVTSDPSATTSADSLPGPSTSLSMVILYTYVPEPTPTKGPSSTASETNASSIGISTSATTIFGAVAVIGLQLMFGW